MQSYSLKQVENLLRPHEYIRDTLSFRYKDCTSCGTRTEFACIKCGYCYSCHWKKEQVEEIGLRDNLKDLYITLSKGGSSGSRQPGSIPQDIVRKQDQRPEKWGTLDVLGQPAEPICTYYRCHHKFSLHGSRRCRCKHPTNKTLGVQVRFSEK